MPALFAITLFLSATLLFLVQPMIAKMLLPKLGGSPQVWNTCMVFYQALLLAGYAYAHFSTSNLGDRKQSRWHILMLLVPFALLLPIGIPRWDPPQDAFPIPWVLAALLVGVGVPFFVVSTSAPLLQRWFAATGHPHGRDPYHLYRASNLGSVVGLGGYLIGVEPFLPLIEREHGIPLPFGGMLAFDQTWVWTFGYVLLVICITFCARALWQSDAAPKRPGGGRPKIVAVEETRPLTVLQRAHWVALAFVPSSLMLGATTYITTDIAAIPLLWVIPLALYLLTFIIVFGTYPEWLHHILVLAMPVLVLLLVFMMMAGVHPPQTWLRILWHLVAFFIVAMVCHGELARTRPPAGQLTEFYLWMSFGGVLGGLFNGIVAPLVFNTHAEYALVMFIACLLAPPLDPDKSDSTRPVLDLASMGILVAMGITLLAFRWYQGGPLNLQLESLLLVTKPGLLYVLVALCLALLAGYVWYKPESRVNRALDLGLAGALALLTIGLVYGLYATQIPQVLIELIEKRVKVPEGEAALFAGLRNFLYNKSDYVPNIIIYGVSCILCYTFVERPIRFGLGVAVILLVGSSRGMLDSDVLFRERSFFGALRVEKGYASNKGHVNRLAIALYGHVNDEGEARHVIYHDLLHGTTLHGKQRTVPTDLLLSRFAAPFMASHPLEAASAWTHALQWRWEDPRREALTYYHKTGPIGQVMEWHRKHKRTPRIAVIGLGTGTMASYAEKDQLLHYYEIDPLVIDIAENPKYFTYLSGAKERGADLKIIKGDARVQMENRATGEFADEKYDVIVVDAFSSDAIPIHLITKEAVEVFLNKLADDGILAYHVSNRHLRLQPVLGNIAERMREEQKNLVGLNQKDSEEDDEPAKSRSDWVILARDVKHFGELATDKRWHQVPTDPKVGVWTDNYSNVLSVFDWN